MCDVQQVLRGLLVSGVNASFGLDSPTSVILIHIESSPHVLEEQRRQQQLAFFFSATTPWQGCSSSSRRPLRPLFSNPRARGERGGRGGSILVSPGMGDGGGLRRPRRPWSCRPGARGELSTSRNKEGRGLALVEDGREVLTSKGIRLR